MLRWDSDLCPDDLRAALTDSIVGLAGATARPASDGWILQYGRTRFVACPDAYRA